MKQMIIDFIIWYMGFSKVYTVPAPQPCNAILTQKAFEEYHKGKQVSPNKPTICLPGAANIRNDI